MTSISAKAQKNLRTIVANEDKRLGKVVDRPILFQNTSDIDEAIEARRGTNLGPRTRELKNIARQQNKDLDKWQKDYAAPQPKLNKKR